MKVQIKSSDKSGKKMMAIFYEGDKKIKTVHFGDKNYQHYSGGHKDEARRQQYIDRHKANEDWNNPMTAGTLSLFILWSKPTIQAGIEAYKKRFNLS